MIIRLLLVLLLLSSNSTAFAGTAVVSLEEAYRAAVGSHELVKIAEEDVLQSGFRVDQAWTYLYPRLNARAAFTRYNDTLPKDGGSFVFQPNEQYQAVLVLTQPLYTGGRTMAALRTAEKMREVSTSGVSVAKQETMFRVAEAYYGVLKAKRFVEVTERSLKRMERHKETTEREAATRKNRANQSSLLRANSLVSQSRIALVRAQDGLRIVRDKLVLLTKLPQDIDVAEPAELEKPAATLQELQLRAVAGRDDYAATKAQVKVAEEGIAIVQGGHYPQVYAEAGLQYQTSTPATMMDATTYYGGLRLQIPIFEGGLMKSEVSEAKSKVRQAGLNVDLLRKTIESEVQESYVNLQTVESVLATAKLLFEYAKGNYDAVEALSDDGLLPSLSLIDAEQALTMAERELIGAGYDRQLAILRLNKSMGLLGKDRP